MITKQNFKTLVKECKEKLDKLGINSSKEYYLYSDEGGLFGNPKFFITDKKNNKIPYSTYHGKLTAHTIRIYIIGRLSCWWIGLQTDYSNEYKIVKL